MTSILTNNAATTALRTLQNTNNNLEMTQGRISTGLRINDAKDNAAYWSIATTMRSDNNTMGAVKDALNLGSGAVDTAYNGMKKAMEVVDEMKKQLVTAMDGSADRGKIQDSISQLQDQLKSIASNSVFSGQNFLDGLAAGESAEAKVTSSVSRQGDNFKLGQISIDTSDMRLFGNNTTKGLLDATSSVKQTQQTAAAAATFPAGNPVTVADDQTYTITVGAGTEAKTATINAATVKSALGTSSATISSAKDYATVINKALSNAGVEGLKAEVSNSAPTEIKFASRDPIAIDYTAAANDPAGALAITPQTVLAGDGTGTSTWTNTPPQEVSAVNIDVSGAGVTTKQIEDYIGVLDKAYQGMTTAAAELGGISSRIDMQSGFVDSLMDTLNKGVGALVDADMTEESTRLQALQTQQQLGVQALSIANQSSQQIMQLFR